MGHRQIYSCKQCKQQQFLPSDSAYLMELATLSLLKTAELPISFPNRTEFNLTFYVTSLDSSCSAVLGFNWLYKYNPLIDWFMGTITFCTTEQRGQALSMSSGEAAMLQEPPPAPNSPTKHPNPEPIPPSTPPTSLCTSDTPPHISMINAAAYLWACQLPGSQSFQLSLSKEGIFANFCGQIGCSWSH